MDTRRKRRALSPAVDDFRDVFRVEHREIRDLLLDLQRALEEGSQGRTMTLLSDVERLCGPHFRYEEEALYPALEEIYGQPFLRHMLFEHDQAIIDALLLVNLAEKRPMSELRAQAGARLVRRLLPHVSNCEGLSIMVELLPACQVRDILEARDRARTADLPLFEWALGPRNRSLQNALRQRWRSAYGVTADPC
ncbi:MAG: hemerythrin domain-containing protein [Gammaproteobacteria bacterium]